MLGKIAPSFVISRVIQNSYYAKTMSIELLKQPFGSHEHYFGMQNPSHYFECRYYGFISKQTPPTEFTCSQEAEQYQKACEKFGEFNEILALVQGLDEFHLQLKTLYIDVSKNVSMGNVLSKKTHTQQQFEEDILNALQRFNKLMVDLESHPQWQNKVKIEIGKFFHLIHNHLADSPRKKQIFYQMDRQQYFI